MDKKKLEEYRKLLLAKRSELASVVINHRDEGTHLGTDGTQDLADEATNTSTQLLSMRLSETERDLIRQIDEALERIETGGFGLCGICGELISTTRLKALPYALLCIDCKQEEELLNP